MFGLRLRDHSKVRAGGWRADGLEFREGPVRSGSRSGEYLRQEQAARARAPGRSGGERSCGPTSIQDHHVRAVERRGELRFDIEH